MSTEKKLAALFEYQKYEGNAALQGVIDSVHARYASAAGRELSMEEMDVVYAAGQQVTREKLAAMIRHISGGNDHERA
jgi:predicted RNA-binding protein with PIN domain